MAQKRQFPVDPILTAIAIAYHNASLIADDLMFRINPLAKEEFKYTVYDLAEGFTVPDTKVGRRGATPEISFSGDEVTASTEDYGLEDPIPQSDIDNSDERFSPVNRSVEQLTNLLNLDREVRVANLAFSSDSYATNNTEALSAGDRFDDPDSDPLQILEDAKNTPVMTPNVITFGQAAWSAFRMHPKVVKAVHGNSGDSGMASQKQVAELLEVDKLLVGKALVNTARKGQNANLQRAWGNKVSLHYQDAMADNRNGTTWGFTAPFKQRESSQWFDKNIGARGGQRVRVVESLKEVVSAKDLGYLIETVTS